MPEVMDGFIRERITDYIYHNNKIEDNYYAIQEIAVKLLEEEGEEGDCIDDYKKEAIRLLFNEHTYIAEGIIDELFNTEENILSWQERNEIRNGTEMWDIMRLVCLQSDDYGTINDVIRDLKNDDEEKIFDKYMYFRGKEMINDDDENELFDTLLEYYNDHEIRIKNNIEEVSKKIAIKKIMRNKLYFCGLAKKISMRDCGIPLVAVN